MVANTRGRAPFAHLIGESGKITGILSSISVGWSYDISHPYSQLTMADDKIK